MSDTDSFIDEVTEEVRRDRLFLLLRRYGWIGIAAVVAIVAGASWREYSRAQDGAAAQALGDSMTMALEIEDASGRAAALGAIAAEGANAQAIVDMAQAGAVV